MVTIYILKLVRDKFYIGQSKDVTMRIQEHFNGIGCDWTRKYKPLEIVAIIPRCSVFDEDKYTIEYMNNYGIDNVRGGTFASINLTQFETEMITKMIRSANGQCVACGSLSHFVKDCPTKKNDYKCTQRETQVPIVQHTSGAEQPPMTHCETQKVVKDESVNGDQYKNVLPKCEMIFGKIIPNARGNCACQKCNVIRDDYTDDFNELDELDDYIVGDDSVNGTDEVNDNNCRSMSQDVQYDVEEQIEQNDRDTKKEVEKIDLPIMDLFEKFIRPMRDENMERNKFVEELKKRYQYIGFIADNDKYIFSSNTYNRIAQFDDLLKLCQKRPDFTTSIIPMWNVDVSTEEFEKFVKTSLKCEAIKVTTTCTQVLNIDTTPKQSEQKRELYDYRQHTIIRFITSDGLCFDVAKKYFDNIKTVPILEELITTKNREYYSENIPHWRVPYDSRYFQYIVNYIINPRGYKMIGSSKIFGNCFNLDIKKLLDMYYELNIDMESINLIIGKITIEEMQPNDKINHTHCAIKKSNYDTVKTDNIACRANESNKAIYIRMNTKRDGNIISMPSNNDNHITIDDIPNWFANVLSEQEEINKDIKYAVYKNGRTCTVFYW